MAPKKSGVSEVDGASPGKIFIGGLAKETTLETFTKYFEKYGEVVDSVIMKDRHTGRPRGFGFITYADPSVVDTVIKEDHIINDKQVEIKRTIPKGAAQTNDFKTKKIFVGGIPTSLTEDEFKDFFSKYGKVVDHEIILDHATKRSRGFGFIIFDNEKEVDDLLANGTMIDMNGTRVEIKKAEPKKASNPAPGSAFGSDSRSRGGYGDNFRGYPDTYSGFGSGYSPASYRGFGGYSSSRFGDYGGYGSGDLGGGYNGGAFGAGGGYAGYRGESSFGYSGRYGSYGGALGGGYGAGLGMNGRGGGDGWGGSGSGAGYGSGAGGYGSGAGGYGSGGAGAMYGNRAGYSGSSRYHPYAR